MATLRATITRWATRRAYEGRPPAVWEVRQQIRRSHKPHTRREREQLTEEIAALVNRLARRTKQAVD